ncbi:MAG: ABC transporter ATP-binding protein [Proteobacteria bacterium]|nr:ABC transporter ATP-binding protein [Pseudomonadota bacterium]
MEPLRVTDLTKTYGAGTPRPVEAVRGVSFEVKAGECFGLLGPNGAGKSTTIQCISGFYPATSGEVMINGANVHTHPRQARQKFGLCSQEETLDSDFKVLDQLVWHAMFYRIPTEAARARAGVLLEQFGLTEHATDLIEKLSGGMRRRLQVARALVAEPTVLVLDEPTTGLDPDARRLLWEALIDYRKKGAAILLSTHYMHEAERLCDRIAVISKGKILDVDSPENLIAKHIARKEVEEEVRPGVVWKRAPNLEDVYLKLTGSKLGIEGL